MKPESNQFLEARCARFEMSIIIDATRERVWRGLTDQLHAWWLPDFHMLGEESKITFEPFAGGRLFETAGGRSLLWYTVLSYDPLKSMEWSGFCTAKYGGPATTLLSRSFIRCRAIACVYRYRIVVWFDSRGALEIAAVGWDCSSRKGEEVCGEQRLAAASGFRC